MGGGGGLAGTDADEFVGAAIVMLLELALGAAMGVGAFDSAGQLGRSRQSRQRRTGQRNDLMGLGCCGVLENWASVQFDDACRYVDARSTVDFDWTAIDRHRATRDSNVSALNGDRSARH